MDLRRLFAVILGDWAADAQRLGEETERRPGGGGVHRKCFLASVTIEDGFVFEAVVPVKSPI